jgi:hypothetical protein
MLTVAAKGNAGAGISQKMQKMLGVVLELTLSPWAVLEPLQGQMDRALARIGRARHGRGVSH